MVYLSILFAISLFALFLYIEINKSLKEQNDTLIFLNKKINKDLNELYSKNATLWQEINSINTISETRKEELENLLADKETFVFSPGTKVKWIDKTGEEEFGIVYDDFHTFEKHLIVVRGMRKDKLTGRYFTVSLEKVTVVE